MNISQETEELFVKWAEGAAKREKGILVLPLRKKIKDYLQRLYTGGGVLTFVGNYKIRDYIKLHTDYAKLFHRTEIIKADTLATLEECAHDKNDLVEVWDIGTVCAICKEYEGKVYSISGDDPKYPVIPALPPFHLGCLHRIRPTSDEVIADRERWEKLKRDKKLFEGLDPDGRCIVRVDGETLTNREWAELLVHRYGDKEAVAWLASLKNIPAER